MSSILYPDRYRCVATFNGVTDVPLLFQSSDHTFTREQRESFAEIVGDPEQEYDRLVSISPIYRAAEIPVPVLIVHGTRDVRVHPDHAWRLRMILEAHGKPFDWLALRGVGHSPDHRRWLAFAAKLRRFLNRHLDTGSIRYGSGRSR